MPPMKNAKVTLLRPIGLFTIIALIQISFATSTHAQGGIGIRGGISARPTQFYFGGHAALGPVVDRLWFRPNVEVGVGDNVTLVALNAEFAYWAPLRRERWNVYFGGGPAANILSYGGVRNRDTNAGPGFNFLLGVAQSRGLFTEVKIGAIDSPSFKFGIGYTFD